MKPNNKYPHITRKSVPKDSRLLEDFSLRTYYLEGELDKCVKDTDKLIKERMRLARHVGVRNFDELIKTKDYSDIEPILIVLNNFDSVAEKYRQLDQLFKCGRSAGVFSISVSAHGKGLLELYNERMSKDEE